MNNDLINELNNKLDAQDKIINEQVLEIARLKEKIAKWEEENTRIFDILDNTRIELYNKNVIINKAIEYINKSWKGCYTDATCKYKVEEINLTQLLEILGDKENE